MYGTGILGTGMDVVLNLPKCPVPVLTGPKVPERPILV